MTFCCVVASVYLDPYMTSDRLEETKDVDRMTIIVCIPEEQDEWRKTFSHVLHEKWVGAIVLHTRASRTSELTSVMSAR